MSAAWIPGSEEVTSRLSPSRRRSWQTLVVVALIAAIYIAGWLCYTARFSARIDRYHELPAGAVFATEDADYRFLGIVQTSYLIDKTKGPLAATADSVWVVTTVEATLRHPKDKFYCGEFQLLGAQNRRFDAALYAAYRPNKQSPCSPDNIKVGVPFVYEEIYTVPLSQIDGIVGLTRQAFFTGETAQVLRPPA